MLMRICFVCLSCLCVLHALPAVTVPDANLVATSTEAGQVTIDANDQSGGDVKNPLTQKTTVSPPTGPPRKVEDVEKPERELPFNSANESYPVDLQDAGLSRKESSEVIAGAQVKDPDKMNVHGVPGPDVLVDRPEIQHPMEILTPLVDNFPCDPDRMLNVALPDASDGVLDKGYGCSDYDEHAREKPSPKVTWSNVSEDVVAFSLQMTDIGGEECNGKGETIGKIHWHVVNITKAPSVTFEKGASHDKRMLNGGVEMPNSWLEEYYSGPCPRPGETGCYRIKVLAHRTTGICQCGHIDFRFTRPDKPPTPWIYKDKKIAPIGVAEIESPLDGFVDIHDVRPDPNFKAGVKSIGLDEDVYNDFMADPKEVKIAKEKLVAVMNSMDKDSLLTQFNFFDVDKDGAIDKLELIEVLKALDVSPKAHILDGIIADFDFDKNGKVTFDEVLKAMVKMKMKKTAADDNVNVSVPLTA